MASYPGGSARSYKDDKKEVTALDQRAVTVSR
jgi:hypothetical protein